MRRSVGELHIVYPCALFSAHRLQWQQGITTGCHRHAMFVKAHPRFSYFETRWRSNCSWPVSISFKRVFLRLLRSDGTLHKCYLYDVLPQNYCISYWWRWWRRYRRFTGRRSTVVSVRSKWGNSLHVFPTRTLFLIRLEVSHSFFS